MGSILQGLFPLKLMRICTRDPTPVVQENSYRDLDPPTGGGKETDMDMNTITNNKPSRVTEMQVGDTLFTVVSVESDRARERLYDKVKRMILNDENSETPPTAAAA